ncbi:clathrin interactor EPSIN 1 isoform X1 [Benincasa hispida]|uniref:clathrin interactor EPSIN 1 isoform X1 n=1 Tax=Benincasa hispida TaxID=102211 RepID=UPI0019020213|nr:clathrin interactor EPSIN 1 isoform X1 [Benincasa hispida]
MTTPSFHDLKKQASFFFKEKIKTARLALTDVTSAELLTEEAINGNPDAKTLSSISRAAFEVDDYWRIVAILHKRLLKFEKKNWRFSYNSLIILEHLLTHGPESVAEEFQSDKDVVTQMGNFQYVDEKGFNWGISVRKRSERILNLLDKRSLLKNERDKARKLTREILGFGSFSLRSKSQGILEHSSSPIARYGKCNSNFNSLDNLDQEHQVLSDQNAANPQRNQDASVVDSQKIEMLETRENVEENLVRNKEELHRWDDGMDKVNLLLSCKREELKNEISADDNHPFIDDEPETNISLLST